MSSSAEKDDKNRSNRVRFRTGDIKEKPTYLTNVKEKPTPKSLLTFLFKGFHKYITIAVAAIVLTGVTLLVLWLTVWRPADLDQTNPPEVSWEDQLDEINNEANTIYESDSDSAYLDAVAYFDEKIAAETDYYREIDLRIYRANFLTYNNGAQFALRDLMSIDEDTLPDEQKYKFYLAIRFAFENTGDEEAVGVYEEKIDALPKDITTIGGPTDDD